MTGLSVIFKAIDEVSAKFEAMASAGGKTLDSFERIEKAADSALSNITSDVDKASDSIMDVAESTDYWTDAIGNYDKECMRAVYSTEELVEMGYMTEDALNQAEKAIEDTTDELEKFAKEADGAKDESEDFGKKSTEAVNMLDDVLAAAGIVMALKAIGEGFMEASAKAAEFESSVAMVSTVADGTVLSSEQLSQQITELSMATGKSVNEIAEATYNAISAGVDTADAVATIGEANKLAGAGFTSNASALSVLTTTLNAYGMEASEISNISDSLVMSQNLGVLTIDQLASSMGKAISTASAYSIDLYNLESAYISLTKAGISVEESTTYVSSMMNELGKAGSDVSDILKEETGKSFGQLMSDGMSLADVLSILYDSVDQSSEAFMNLWGSAEAGKAGNAIINQGLEQFNTNLDKLTNSAGTTELAYQTMANTTQFSTQRMQNSLDNLAIAIGDDINPIVAGFNNTVADITDNFTKLVEKHPAVTGMITAITAVVGTLVLALGGYKVAMVAATLATKAWTAVMAMNPVFLAITAVAALTAGIVAFCAVANDAEDDTHKLSAASLKLKEDVNSATKEYEKACEVYGENSVEAWELKQRVDELTDSYENSKQTVEEFYQQLEDTKTMVENVNTEYANAMDAIDNQYESTDNLIKKLGELQSKTELTRGEQELMARIVEELNSRYKDLGLVYDSNTQSINMSIEALRNYAKAEKLAAENAEKMDKYIANMDIIAQQTKDMETAQANYDAQLQKATIIQNEFNAALDAAKTDADYMSMHSIAHQNADAQAALAKYEEALNSAKEALAATEEEQLELEKALAGTSETADDASSTITGSFEAVEYAASLVTDEIKKLGEEYDAAYEKAYESISNQIGLFDTMKTETEQSVADMQTALQSQIEYLNLYTENLQKAKEYGLDESLISSLSDGSAESAGQLDAIISKIEELGGTTEQMSSDAQAFIDSFNTSFSEVETAKETFANSVAEMETNFSERLDGIEKDMNETVVEGLNLSDEAESSAIATINAYIEGIKSKIPEVNSALASIEWAASNMSTFNVPTIPKAKAVTDGMNAYAVGTESAEPGIALVGEEGPELVDFSGGERVYTTDETKQMLSKEPIENDDFIGSAISNETNISEDKTITLKIEGAGEMTVGGNGANKEDILNVLVDNVKGVLMNIIQQEIMEEGQLTYEF